MPPPALPIALGPARVESSENPAEAPSDDALVARWMAGEDVAFDALVRRYHRQLFGFLVRQSANHQDAEEAYAETLVKLFRGRSSYQEQSTFRSWLFQIARRCAIDVQRRRRRWIRLLQRTEAYDLPSAPPSPDGPLRTAERKASVDEAIAALPEEHRAAVLLRYRYDLDHDEVAVALSLTERQVRDRLSYARRVLRDLLPKESFHD